jgi:hypothetical protein
MYVAHLCRHYKELKANIQLFVGYLEGKRWVFTGVDERKAPHPFVLLNLSLKRHSDEKKPATWAGLASKAGDTGLPRDKQSRFTSPT